MTIQNARSNTSSNAPSSLQDGQIAINQADGVLYSRNPDGTIRRFLLPKRRGFADTLATLTAVDTYVGITSITASRPIMLPAASAYPVGHPLAIVDESGSVSPTVSLTVTPLGTDKINGVSSLALTTGFGGVLLFSDGSSKWTAIALPAGTASNAVLYVQQALTGGQQDQARANISGGIPATQTSTTTLAALDFDKDQSVTGAASLTLTMPSAVAPGWRSGIISNDNTITGLATLAVPAGHSLDGVTNGTTVLSPSQRARLQLVSAGTWRTVWVDRSPIITAVPVTTAVASIDINLPFGFNRFRFSISGVTLSAANAVLAFQLSAAGSGGVRSGASDYSTVGMNSVGGGAPFGYLLNGSYGTLVTPNAASPTTPILFQGMLTPGDASNNLPDVLGTGVFRSASNGFQVTTIGSQFVGTTSGAIGRANLLRLLASTGNINAGGVITIWGEP